MNLLKMWRLFRRRRRSLKFARQNYPVSYLITPKGVEWILVRNLTTHQYGGWLVSIEDAIKRWGTEVVNRIKVA